MRMRSKADKEVKTYHVGDAVPTEGDSFEYPGYFDIVSLEDNAAVLIRDKRVQDIIPLDEYVFMGLPVVDERGFALEIRSNDDYQQFLKEFTTQRTTVIVDPVMGDYGKLYATYTQELCQGIGRLVQYADILTPNVTEACILTGTPYQGHFTEAL